MAYVTLAECKLMLGIDDADTSEDSLLTDLLSEAQNAIDVWCGDRSFEAQTATRYYGPDAVEHEYLILGRDLLSVTTLTNGDAVVLAAAAYWLWPRNATPASRLRLKSNYSWTFSDLDAEISVLGSWGYSTTAPAGIQRATKEYVHFLYHDPDARRVRLQGAAKAGVLPEHIRDLLVSYRKLT